MKQLKKFEEFLKENVVKKQFPDKFRAKDLEEDSDKLYNSLADILDKTGVNDINSSMIIKESHDVIMGLIRSRMLLRGFSASGIMSHEAEVSFLRVLGFNESEVEFANQLRYFRNGIMYYGKKFDSEYAEKVFKFMKSIIIKLKKL